MCILATMLQTPLAVLRRTSSSGSLTDVAKALGTRASRLSAVEAGREAVSEDFLATLARALGLKRDQVTAAYLVGRREYLRKEVREIEGRLSDLRGPVRRTA